MPINAFIVMIYSVNITPIINKLSYILTTSNISSNRRVFFTKKVLKKCQILESMYCKDILINEYIGNRHGISLNPSADRFDGQKFPLSVISVFVTRSHQFPTNFRSQFVRVCAFFHVKYVKCILQFG